MPKRTNPFGSDYSPLQMKMHVTQREVNLGVNRETNMKVVYDRTRELLYNGQKGFGASEQEVEMRECPMAANGNDQPNGADSPPSFTNKQFQLNAGGHLIFPSHHQKQPMKNSMAASGKIVCNTCRNSNVPVHFACSHCEKNMCYNCRQTCTNCEGGFCSNCSTVNYDERCDRIFCLNCAF